MGQRTHQRSLAGGEVSPAMRSQIGDAFYQNGAAELLNFVVTTTGAARRRKGLRFVAEVKDSTKRTRMLPFIYSTSQSMAVEAGEGYFRFHTQGATLLHATPRIVTAAADDIVTFTAAHGLASNTQVKFTCTGTMPAGLSELVTYYVISDTSTTIKVSAATGPGGAVNITDAGTGVLRLFLASEAPRNYISSKNFTVVSGTSTVNLLCTAHGLIEGDIVMLVNTANDLPLGLQALNSYFVKFVDVDTFQLAATLGGTAITFADNGTGTSRFHRNYRTGETVSWIGTGPGFFYARTDFWRECNVSETNDYFGATAHTLADGTVVRFRTNGTLPTGVVEGSNYFVVNSTADTFKVSATYQGSAIDLTDTTLGTTEFSVIVIGDSAPPAASFIWHQMPDTGVYEIPTPYLEADIFGLELGGQSADVLTILNRNYRPAELRRYSATLWALVQIPVQPVLSKPVIASVTASRGEVWAATGNPSVSPGVTATIRNASSPTIGHALAAGDTVLLEYSSTRVFGVVSLINGDHEIQVRSINGAGSLFTFSSNTPIAVYPTTLDSENSQNYQVTALTAYEAESEPSASFAVTNNLLVRGALNTVVWGTVSGASRYRIYRGENKPYALIGVVEHNATATTFTFIDRGEKQPDASFTPPYLDVDLVGSGNYPGAGCYFEQRRLLASTTSRPEETWLTRSGTNADLSYHIPVLDSDRIRFGTPDSRQIRHAVNLSGNLILLASEGEIRVSPVATGAITPSSVSPRFQSHVGSSPVAPIIVDSALIFYADRGGSVREFGYQDAAGGYVPGNLSIRAQHLFTGETIVDAALAKAPYQIAWQVSSSGRLLGLTYVPSERIGAWHQHITGPVDDDGEPTHFFESCCCVPEDQEDILYVIVQRPIDSDDVRYVECLFPFGDNALADENFLDSSVTYSGAAVTSVPLPHLEGEEVLTLSSGIVLDPATVSGGVASVAGTKIQCGLEMVSEIITLPPAMQIDGFGQGRNENVAKAWVRVEDSCQFQVGPYTDPITGLIDKGSRTARVTGPQEVVLPANWTIDGQVVIRQGLPLPLTVVGITLLTQTAG